MKALKKRYYFLLALLFLLLFRGAVFRLFVSYQPVGERTVLGLSDPDLRREISDWAAAHPAASATAQIAFSRRLTARHATFVMRSVSSQPDDVCASGQANCVGYARLFAASLEAVNDAIGQGRTLSPSVLIGELSLFGQSLHQLTDDPFWRDHDYNKVVNLKTGEVYFLDATLYDYSGIKWVREGR